MSDKPLAPEKLRAAIVSALNLLSAAATDTILGRLSGEGRDVERMAERLRDHLREAIGLKTYPGLTGVEDADALAGGNAAADHWLKVTGYVRDKRPLSSRKKRIISTRSRRH